MTQFDRRGLINESLFKAKLGDQNALKTIRDMYGFVLDQVSFALFNIYDFLKYNRGLLHKEFYDCLIETISEYRFKDTNSFGATLKKNYVSRIQKLLIIVYSLSEGSVAKQSVIYSCIKKDGKIDTALRKECLLGIKHLKPKIKFVCFLKMYKGMNETEFAYVYKKENVDRFANIWFKILSKRIQETFSEEKGATIYRRIDKVHRIVDIKATKKIIDEYYDWFTVF